MAKKRGRPALPPGKRRQASMGFRPTKEIRERLEKAAKENGRSVSREIESRLERSFAEDDVHIAAFGGQEAYNWSLMLASTANAVSQARGKSWISEKDGFHAVLPVWQAMHEHIRDKTLEFYKFQTKVRADIDDGKFLILTFGEDKKG